MQSTSFEGVVRNGAIVLPDGIVLPENTKVLVVIPEEFEITLPSSGTPVRVLSPHIKSPEDARRFELEVNE